MDTSDLLQRETVFSVSMLNSSAKSLLEEAFTDVWVEGEISNFAAPASGHWYFSLKDATAQVRVAMFRGNQRRLGFTPKDGLHVLLKARVSLYEARGEYQLIAEFMEERGEGKLRRAYEALKKKLEAAGLFATEHKQSLPLFPKQIGVVTSPTGAAIRDILTVLKRRYPAVPVIIYPTLVQGATAAAAITDAITLANKRGECDVLIIARGGGSLEDLWPFNEEMVAQAIYQSSIPTISGVGHEVDFTIADFVADVRAPTPSAAAEIATPDIAELLPLLSRQQHQIQHQMKTKLNQSQQQLAWTQKHLGQLHPKKRLAEKMQQLDFYELTLTQCLLKQINTKKNQIQHTQTQLHRQSPLATITKLQNQIALNTQQLKNVMQINLQHQQTALANAASKLDALSPLATLKRGFAIATLPNAKIVHDANQVKKDDLIDVRLHHGKLHCKVEKISV